MTRYRGGGVSIKSLNTNGRKATLKCKCGYEKTIRNPFGGRMSRDEVARQRLRSVARQAKHERKNRE